MHARFNFDPAQRDWSRFVEAGRTIHLSNKAKVEVDLRKFKNSDGVLQAKDVIQNWFPEIKANVFLSHSHKDEEMILGFAGWLSQEFGLMPFIDSAVWGYSDTLLRAIDGECDQYIARGVYNYNRRNRSTSHVHMMLSTALMNMIDSCECIIFVNTFQSFKPSDYYQNDGETESPWIYSEIAMTRMLRQKSPEEHRPKMVLESVNGSSEMIKKANEVRVNYPVDLLHLTPLSIADIDLWSRMEGSIRRQANSLDALYVMKANRHGR